MEKREEAQTFSAHYSFSSITPAWATDRPTCSPTRAPACEAAAAWGPLAQAPAPPTSAPSPTRTPARGHRRWGQLVNMVFHKSDSNELATISGCCNCPN